jgi:hypothetical protein
MRFGARAGLCLFAVLVASSARADRVMVLELRGDAHGRLRAQIEQAVKRSKELELVPLSRVREVARGHGLSEAQLTTPSGVAVLAPALKVSIAVGGSVGSKFLVRLFDPAGQELWSRELPLRHGLLGADLARKLVKAIAAAAEQVHARPPPEEESAVEPVPLAPEEPPEAAPTPKPPVAIAPSPGNAPAPGNAPEPVSAPVAVSSEPAAEWAPRPPWLTLELAPTLSLRSYCATPGVSSCGQYDALDPSQKPPGGSVQFDAKVPYLGVRLGLDLFPLTGFEAGLAGLGLVANYHLGLVRTDVTLVGEGGSTPVKTVRSIDHSWQLALAYRRFFDRADRLVGWYGVRAGLGRRSFDVDNSVAAVLPGSHRTYPVIAADLRYPFHRRFSLDASAELFPGASPGVNEIVPFGAKGSGFGFGGALGAAGEIKGRFGYLAHLRYTRYSDTFTGAGTQWPSGGVAAESYLVLEAGLTLAFQ